MQIQPPKIQIADSHNGLRLSPDALTEILQFLPTKDLCVVPSVCAVFYDAFLSFTPDFWLHRLSADCNAPAAAQACRGMSDHSHVWGLPSSADAGQTGITCANLKACCVSEVCPKEGYDSSASAARVLRSITLPLCHSLSAGRISSYMEYRHGCLLLRRTRKALSILKSGRFEKVVDQAVAATKVEQLESRLRSGQLPALTVPASPPSKASDQGGRLPCPSFLTVSEANPTTKKMVRMP